MSIAFATCPLRVSVLEKILREKFSDSINLVEICQSIEFGTLHVNITACADVIIISTHCRSGWDHVLLGSVTEKLSHTRLVEYWRYRGTQRVTFR
jgi:hypothetical protein